MLSPASPTNGVRDMAFVGSVWFYLLLFITYPLHELRMVRHYYRIREAVEREALFAKELVWLHRKDLECLGKLVEQLVEARLGLTSAKQKALELTRSRMEELVVARRKNRDRLYPEVEAVKVTTEAQKTTEEPEAGGEEDSG